jgi:hypothetical protein
MKTKFLFMMIAATIVFAGCKKPELSVTPADIPATCSVGTYAVAVTSNVAWTASVDSAATWCTVSPANGTGNDTVTVNVAENPTIEERTATIAFTAGKLACAVDVTQAGQAFYAASARTWTFGNQTWSDAIHMPECNKTSFTNSRTVPQCRSYTSAGNIYYYYNWAYVNANKSKMCPSPWRVPTYKDFKTLKNNTTPLTLFNAWGYSGFANGNSMGLVGLGAFYWSSTKSSNTNKAYYLDYYLDYDGGDLLVADITYGSGYQVRCVK